VNTRVAEEKKESLARKRPPKPTHPTAFNPKGKTRWMGIQNLCIVVDHAMKL
jgi:hypothetical protein